MAAKLSLMNGVETTNFEVRESDQYSGMVYMKITRDTKDGADPIGEIFLDNATQLDILGSFLIAQAANIRNTQAHRKLEQAIDK